MGKFRPELTSRLTSGVTNLTLDFAPMMAVSDETLQGCHTEASLDALVERITTVCLHLSKFRININTSRNEEWVEDQEELDLPTTYIQYRVIEQMLGLVVKVMQSSK